MIVSPLEGLFACGMQMPTDTHQQQARTHLGNVEQRASVRVRSQVPEPQVPRDLPCFPQLRAGNELLKLLANGPLWHISCKS